MRRDKDRRLGEALSELRSGAAEMEGSQHLFDIPAQLDWRIDGSPRFHDEARVLLVLSQVNNISVKMDTFDASRTSASSEDGSLIPIDFRPWPVGLRKPTVRSRDELNVFRLPLSLLRLPHVIRRALGRGRELA